MKILLITATALIILSSSLFTHLYAAEPILEQVAAMISKQLPRVTSSGESEQYKVMAENDTLVFYYKFYGVKKSEVNINEEASQVLNDTLKIQYCAQPYDHYQKMASNGSIFMSIVNITISLASKYLGMTVEKIL